jgi:hypothetical protein
VREGIDSVREPKLRMEAGEEAELRKAEILHVVEPEAVKA